MTDYNTLVALLQKMAADQLGKYQCYGCGHEHNCQTKGCAILREAVATMEQLYKDCGELCTNCKHFSVPGNQEPCKSCARYNESNVGKSNWQWQGVQMEGKDNG